MRKIFCFWVCIMSSYVHGQNSTFESVELISSKNERIYINSVNWGVTGDHQYSIVSKNKKRLIKSNDTLNAIKGLEPFIYSFKQDSLILYFNSEISYKIKESFKTIKIKYVKLNNINYLNIYSRAILNENYHTVPKRTEVDYPSDMPKPPR